jgi:hypothetical protein
MLPEYEVRIEKNGRIVRKAIFPTENAALEWGEQIVREFHRLPNSHRHRFFIVLAEVPNRREKEVKKQGRQREIEDTPGPHTARVSYTWSDRHTRRTKLVEKRTFDTRREASAWVQNVRSEREASEPALSWQSSTKPATPHEEKLFLAEKQRRAATEEAQRRSAEHKAWRESPEGQAKIQRQNEERARAEEARRLTLEKETRNQRIKIGVAVAAWLTIVVILFINLFSTPQTSGVKPQPDPPRVPEGVTACEQIGRSFRIDPDRDPYDLDHDGDGIACEQ